MKNHHNISDIFDHNISLSTRELYLCGQDGTVDDKLAINFIKGLRILENISKDPIIIHQYSIGGDVTAGFAIFDAIVNSPCKFCFVCHGCASSMGSLIPQAVHGKGIRVTTENCEWLIHDGELAIEGGYKKISSTVDYWNYTKTKMRNIYIDVCHDTGEFYSGKDKKEVKKYIDNQLNSKEDWILNGSDAIWFGFADKLLSEMSYEDVLRIL